MDAGLYGVASDQTRQSEELHQEVLQRTSQDLDLRVAMEPVPPQAFGSVPRGYGQEWILVGVGLSRSPGVASSVRLDLDFQGWTTCTGCDLEWILAQMATPEPEGEEPSSSTVKVGGRRWSGGDDLAALGRGLWETTKMIGAFVLLPITAITETALLLERGGDPDAATGGRLPPLHRVVGEASDPGASRAARVLLEAGADPTALFRQRSALAELGGSPQGRALVVHLLDAGADPSAFLCDAPDVGTSELLLERDAQVDAPCFGLPPLHRAVERHDAEQVGLYLDRGADVHQVGMAGQVPVRPLHLAVLEDWVEGIELLVERGADPDLMAGIMGAPPLVLAEEEPTALALVHAGALRSVPTELDRLLSYWEAAPLRPAERCHLLTVMAAHPELDLPPEMSTELGDVPMGRLQDSVQALGPQRFASLCAELRADHGCPLAVERQGPVRAWTWEGLRAEGWQVHPFKAAVLSTRDVGSSEDPGVLGMSRAAVWIRLGEPYWPGPSTDIWADLRAADYQEGRAAAVGCELGQGW